ncbi:MAG: DUF1097 domain-containing protein [Eubacterium sp.]
MNQQTNYFLKMSVVSGLLAGVLLGIYQITSLSSLMWPIFIGLGVTFATGAELKKAPNYLCCMLAGVVWALVYFQMDGFFSGLGLNPGIVTGISTFIITFAVCAVHLILLAKTWLNVVPLVFAGLTVTFSQGGQNLIGIIIALAFGILAAVLIEPLTKRFMKDTALQEVFSKEI